MWRILAFFLPDGLFYRGRPTVSARRFMFRFGTGVLAIVVVLVAIGLLDKTNWPEVLSGAGFAWGVTLVVWSITSYRNGREEAAIELRRVAELDLLHHRLNQAASHLKIPVLDLNSEIEDVLNARVERLAHFGGRDEFRGSVTQQGQAFWG